MVLFWVLIGILVILLISIALSIPITRKQKQKAISAPDQYNLLYNEISFTTSDRLLLRGWWIPATNSTRTIIFLHGYAGSCDPDLKYVPAFHEKGFNVLLFDFRAHGRSEGNLTSVGVLEKRDCLAAITFAKRQGSLSIGLLGFSMGGRVALLTAPESDEIKAVISDGSPARLLTAFAAELHSKGLPMFLTSLIAFLIELGASLRTRNNLFVQEPLYQAGRLKGLPVLFIHGDHDPYTRIGELERMVQAAGEKAECWRIAQAGHRDADLFCADEYLERITAFFERYLSLDSSLQPRR